MPQNHYVKEVVERICIEFFRFASIYALILLILVIGELFLDGVLRLPESPVMVVLHAAINTLVFWLKYYIVFLTIFAIAFIIKPKSANISIAIIFVLMILLQALLAAYFAKAFVPLGSDLFGYSKDDIFQTIGSSGAVSALTVVLFLGLISLVCVMLIWLPAKVKANRYAAQVVPFVSLLMLCYGFSLPSGFKSDFANNAVLNKSDYFYTEAYTYAFPDVQETDIYSDNYLGETPEGSTQLISFKYIDEDKYPFLHTDQTPDVLSPFFLESQRPPNIVIILVEGLGRSFSGPDASLGSFTPFLDSLASQSVYYKNMLSSGGRTFAVLPSVLGSLPFATNGFLELGDKMPQHLSLLNILEASGYQTSFYYGGDGGFDNMDLFLKRNGINELHDEHSFPKDYQKLPSQNGFSWGYNDFELYRRYFATRYDKGLKPQLSVLLTVSSHSPFLVNDQVKYLDKFSKRLKTLEIDDSKLEYYQTYKNQFASVLYADDALRRFFAKYSSRSDFKNTVFLITGDHRLPEIPMETKIDRYHVPLIIYSPLLKRTATIESLSSHFDITPSILAFLHKRSAIQRPSLCSWIGAGLDTSRSMRNIHAYPLIQTKTNQVDFVSGNYHFNNGSVYKFAENLAEDIMNEKQMASALQSQFNIFKRKNRQLQEGKKIIPDSLYLKYQRN